MPSPAPARGSGGRSKSCSRSPTPCWRRTCWAKAPRPSSIWPLWQGRSGLMSLTRVGRRYSEVYERLCRRLSLMNFRVRSESTCAHGTAALLHRETGGRMSADASDLSLVRCGQHGDKVAFDGLVLKYQHKLVKL